jgi:hypothetical protein
LAAVALQYVGKFVAAGSASNGAKYDFMVARSNRDGSLNPTFGGGGALTGFNAADDYAKPDGKIVVAGKADDGATGDHFALAGAAARLCG